MGLPYITYALVVTILVRDPFLSVFSVVIAFGLVVFLSILRDKPPSRTIKTAEFIIKGNRERILEDCLAALEKIGAHIGSFDAAEGVIEASTKMTWRSFGEIIKIEVCKPSPKGVSLRVTSDAVQPSVLFDFGANARNIHRIKTELLR